MKKSSGISSYLVRRFLLVVPTLFGIVTFVFLILKLIPGSPARMILGEWATEEAVKELESQLGLDKPLFVQYVNFIWNYLRGDLGISLVSRRSVISEVMEVFPYTLTLAIAGTAISLVIGLSVGVISAMKRNSIVDHTSRVLALVGVSMPAFWLGLLLLIVFSLNLRLFPIRGAGEPGDPISLLHHLALPATTLGTLFSALTMRMTRSALLEVLSQDYIRTARAKGASEPRVLLNHALKNAAIPIVTVVGLNFGSLLGGAVVTETVFSRPGLGKLIVDGVLYRDYPLVQGSIFVFSVLFILVNLLVDLTYSFLDPRVRAQ